MGEIAFPLRSGGVVYVEVDARDKGGLVSRGGVAVEAGRTFEDAISGLAPVAEALLGQIRALAQSPDEVTLEFGVTLKLEAGVLIAKTAGEGNFKVEVKWKRGD